MIRFSLFHIRIYALILRLAAMRKLLKDKKKLELK
nr:MAG TPA: hypothetical protein [Caudoviricetes sp.]